MYNRVCTQRYTEHVSKKNTQHISIYSKWHNRHVHHTDWLWHHGPSVVPPAALARAAPFPNRAVQRRTKIGSEWRGPTWQMTCRILEGNDVCGYRNSGFLRNEAEFCLNCFQMSNIRKWLPVQPYLRDVFFLQDAFRVAVALWALSDGKTLSLQLLVGALEGKAGWEILLPSICWVKSEYSVKKTFISTAHPKNWWEKQI